MRSNELTPETHPVDQLLRAVTGDPAPSLADHLSGRRALADAIASEGAGARVRSRPARGFRPVASWWRPASLATSALVLAIAVVAVAGLLRPQPVTALGELAEVAERVAAPAADAGEYLYTRTFEASVTSVLASELGLDRDGYVSYVRRVFEERWVALDGSVHREITFQSPVFFDAEAEAAFAASLHGDFEPVGETVIDDFVEVSVLDARSWSEEAATLLGEMRTFVTNEGNAIVNDAAVVELAADLLRAPDATPELRSAALGALDLMDVEIQQRSNTESVIVSIQYTVDVVQRLELEFDSMANLVGERLIQLEASPVAGTPAGAVLQDSTYSPARVVPSLDAP